MAIEILKYKSIYNIITNVNSNELYVLEISYRKTQPEISKKAMQKPYYALHLFLKGSGTLITDQGKFPIKKGDIWVRFPNEKIQYYDNQDDPYSYIFITFNGSLANKYLSRLNITPNNRFIDSSSKLDYLFSEAVFNCQQHIESKDIISQAYLLHIFSEINNQSKNLPASQSVQSIQQAYIDKAIAYIDIKYIDYNLRAKDVASYLNLNCDYFLRIFKNQSGLAYVDYIIQKRMNKSVYLIEKEKEYNVTNLASKVGYMDVSYFSSSFKKHFGLSPSEYIKKYK